MHCSPFIYHIFCRPKIATKFYKWYLSRKIKILSNTANKKVLDFCCGTGNNSFFFNSSFYLGVDIDSERINFAKKLYPEYSFLTIEDGKIDVKRNSFDFIVICAVLHHLTDKQVSSYIHNFEKILKPQGKLIILEPCFFVKSGFSNWVMQTFDEGGYIRSKDEYFNLLNGKFKIEVFKKMKLYNFYNMLFFSAEKIDY